MESRAFSLNWVTHSKFSRVLWQNKSAHMDAPHPQKKRNHGAFTTALPWKHNSSKKNTTNHTSTFVYLLPLETSKYSAWQSTSSHSGLRRVHCNGILHHCVMLCAQHTGWYDQRGYLSDARPALLHPRGWNAGLSLWKVTRARATC